ncbi:MAG: diguanylate cyclase [Kineosporiaceae bacterium]
MNSGRASATTPVEQLPLQLVQGGKLRLDLLERRLAQVESLLGAVPHECDEATARIWLADAERLLPVAGEFDRARLLQACAVVRDHLARVGRPSARQAFRDDADAAALYEQLGESAHAATCYVTAAISALRCEEVSEALELAVRGLVAFESLSPPMLDGDRAAEARMAGTLALLCCQFFDHERALRFAEIALNQTTQGQRRWTASARLMAQMALLRARELGPDDAPRRAQLLDIADELGRALASGERGPVALVVGPRLVAEVLCERDQPRMAWAALERAEESARGPVRGRPTYRDLAELQLARGRCLLMLDRPHEALTELDGALGGLHPDRDLVEHLQALELRSTARERAGDTAGALADMRSLSELVWVRHRRQIGGFMDQIWGRAGVEGRRRDLEAREEILIRTAEQDPLTGLANRRGVERFCAAMAPGDAVCLVMVDIDHFKTVNDRFGHAVGDATLREVAQVLSSSVRAVDRVARWGGEEFLLALPTSSVEFGAEVATRVRRRAQEHHWEELADGLGLTLSAGVACGPADDLTSVLHRADAALYAAKRTGRNRVVTG